MQLQWKDTLQQIRTADCELQLFDLVSAITKRLGFEHCSYGIRVPLPASKPTVAIFDTYPSGWMEHYQKSRYIDVDPTVRDGAKHTRLIVWPRSPSDAPVAARRLWTDAHDHRLVVGCAQSSWSAYGVGGLLSVSRPADRLTEAEIDLLAPQMNWLTNHAHARMIELLVPRLMPETNIALTKRESEVLRWTSEGKTSAEIGGILHIAERTVNFHVNKVLLKLNATNKVHAVAKAISAGLFDLQ